VYKITYLKLFAIMALAAWFHLTVLDHLRVLGCRGDLMLSLVIFFGLFGGAKQGFVAGLFAGLVNDIYSSGGFGYYTVALSLTGFLMGKIAPRFYREARFAQFFLTAVSYILLASLYYAFIFITGGFSVPETDWLFSYSDFFVKSVIPGSIYAGLISVVTFRLLMEWFEVRDRLML